MRRVQLEEGFGLGFLPVGRSERFGYSLRFMGFRNKVLFPTSGIRALVRVGAMTGEDGKTSGIEKFDGTDFGYWKMQIEDYVWYKFATSAHKYDYEEKKNMMILAKEGLL
uniref:Uncharacterized protein n=1 Tax=Fagus sylvatica TaxID=28930 RepID=A0A2N9F2M9_FAGSY